MSSRCLRSVFSIALASAFVACNEATSVSDGTARIRIVNSVFQGDDPSASVPITIDVLIDSASTVATAMALPSASLATGDASGEGAGAHDNAATIFTAAGYRDLRSGVHSFVARVSGTTPPSPSLYHSSSGEFLPRQYLLPFPHTLVVAGIVPSNDTVPDGSAVPYVMLTDDPFRPPDSAGGLTARVQVINAAPMADPSGLGTDITATFDDGVGGVFTATASYRGTSGYINPPAGNYTLTLTTSAGTLYTDTITLAKGEVRSLIVQSTAYAAVPGPDNTKVTNLLDNRW